ncbi:hypothetical protein ACHWQZ_G011017 [Mnemiopsis leidyi]
MSNVDSTRSEDPIAKTSSTETSQSFTSENNSPTHQYSVKKITILKRPATELNSPINTENSNQPNSEPSIKKEISCQSAEPTKLDRNDNCMVPAMDLYRDPPVDAKNEECSALKSSDTKESNKSESEQKNCNVLPNRKLPDLPADLEPLKARCTSMSQEVLQLLSHKIKEDLVKTKEAKNMARTQQLRELSWKVTDMLALGSSAVKEIETKSAYQLQRDREMKKYKNKINRQWNSQSSGNFHDPNAQGKHQWRQHRQSGQRGHGGRRNYGNRSNFDTNQNWRAHGFNFRAAKKFAKPFVKQVISRAQQQLLAEDERHAKDQIEKTISMAKEVVDTVLGKAIQILVTESTMTHNNLSLTEAELLRDMCEESISDEESFFIDVEDTIPIKKEPQMAC